MHVLVCLSYLTIICFGKDISFKSIRYGERDGKGKYSYSSAHGDILFCAKTRKLRNVRRDKLKQLSLKNFTGQTLQNYGWGGAPGENGNGLNLNLNLNPYLGQSEDERQGPGRGCESERDELRL